MVTKYGIDSSKIEELAKQFKEAADNLAEQIVADYNYVLSSWRSWAHD